jgi:hypothetical protein
MWCVVLVSCLVFRYWSLIIRETGTQFVVVLPRVVTLWDCSYSSYIFLKIFLCCDLLVTCLLYFRTSLGSSDLGFLLRVFVARLKLSIVYRHLDFGATKYLLSGSGCSWNTPPIDYARSDTNSIPFCTTLACHVLNLNHVLQFGYSLQIMCRTDLNLLRQNHKSVQNYRLNFCLVCSKSSAFRGQTGRKTF